jgi:hypothetical protein
MYFFKFQQIKIKFFFQFSQLDGETDWKLRVAVSSTQNLEKNSVNKIYQA